MLAICYNFIMLALSQQTLERKTGSASTPQSLGPQCRAPVILPSIGGDNNDVVWVLLRPKADNMVQFLSNLTFKINTWFPQRTKSGVMVRFFCLRLLVALF